MSPVSSILSSPTTPSSSTTTIRCATYSPTTHQQRQQHDTNKYTTPTQKTTSADSPPVLLLEGDNFEVSHDGVARTFYHLTYPHNHPSDDTKALPLLGIEEYYNLQEAHKTFVLRRGDDTPWSRNENDDADQVLLGRQAQGLAPMGQALGHVEIQEIDEGVFGSAGTGATTWESSLVMSLFFADRAELLRGSLLELGCGVGVGSILSHLGPLVRHRDLPLQSVTLTDGNDRCLQQCRQNIRQAWQSLSLLFPGNENPPEIQVRKLDWNDDLDNCMLQQFDTILACDVCYLYPDVTPLASTIRHLLRENGKCHLFGPYNRGALQSLCQRLHDENMDVNIESLDLERYRLKPAESSRPSSLLDPVQTDQRVYASKSHATILHVTVRHRDEVQNNGDNGQQNGNMSDLD